MLPLETNKIKLRALEPSDLNFLYTIENDPFVWEVSNTQTPFSKHVLELYLQNAHLDIYTVKQLRLMICNLENEALGTVDIYDFDPQHRRAGIGIFIVEKERKKGLAKEALSLVCDYSFSVLGLNQLFCGIAPSNTASKKLFETIGFVLNGQKKQWRRNRSGEFEDELFFQLLQTDFKS